ERDVQQRVPEGPVFLRDSEELDHGSAGAAPSLCVSARARSAGSARAPVFFRTWPTNQPNVWVLPARYAATCAALPATISPMIASSAPASRIAPRPRSATIPSVSPG